MLKRQWLEFLWNMGHRQIVIQIHRYNQLCQCWSYWLKINYDNFGNQIQIYLKLNFGLQMCNWGSPVLVIQLAMDNWALIYALNPWKKLIKPSLHHR